MQRATFRLAEECSGIGELLENGAVLRQVRYTVSRYQGLLEGSGMPIPGLHRIEGSIDFRVGVDEEHLIGAPLTLRLEDGRTLPITLEGREGRISSEGHGPRAGCACC